MVETLLPSASQDEPFIGINLRVGSWPDLKAMCRSALDKLEPSQRILLIFNGYHSICLNSPALKWFGLSPEGHTGLIEEGEAFRCQQRLGDVGDANMDHYVQEAATAAA